MTPLQQASAWLLNCAILDTEIEEVANGFHRNLKLCTIASCFSLPPRLL